MICLVPPSCHAPVKLLYYQAAFTLGFSVVPGTTQSQLPILQHIFRQTLTADLGRLEGCCRQIQHIYTPSETAPKNNKCLTPGPSCSLAPSLPMPWAVVA